MNNRTKLLVRDALYSTVFSIILIFGFFLFIVNINFFNPIKRALKDYNYLDVFYAENFHDTTNVSTDVVLVNIQNNNRLEIAQMLEIIISKNPKTIGVDIIFRDKKENVFADSLLAALLVNEKIITASVIEDDGLIVSHSYFGNSGSSGFVNFNFDRETSVIREFIGIANVFGKERLSFASQIAKHYLNETDWQSFDYDNKLKNKNTIKFKGYYNAFQYLDFEDLLENDNKHFFKDKIVLLGYLGSPTGSKTDIADKFFTPLNKINVGKSDADMFGTTIHANIINMLIYNNFMYTVSNFWIGLITFITMFCSTMFYMKNHRKHKVTRRSRKLIYQLACTFFLLGLSFWLFKNNVVFKPAIVIVGIILSGSYFKYHGFLINYINLRTGWKWKTYLK